MKPNGEFAEAEASFLRLIDKVTNGAKVEIDYTGALLSEASALWSES